MGSKLPEESIWHLKFVNVNGYSSSQICLTPTWTSVPCGIRQCYTCHPAEVTFPPLPQQNEPIKAVTRFSDPEWMQGWVNLCSITAMCYIVGPIPWGYSGHLCHALSLSLLLLLLLSCTSHAACAIAIAGVRLATPGDWQCNGGSQ